MRLGETGETGWVGYEHLIAEGSATEPSARVLPSDTFALMYTSATTGRPKGVIRSHEGSTLIALAIALEMRFTRDDVSLMFMPMCHANSPYFSHTFGHLGAACVVDDRRSFDPEALLAILPMKR